MRKSSAFIRTIPYLFIMAFLTFGLFPAIAAEEGAPANTVSFFSQGQALYNQQDQAASQRMAVQDFLGQALIQAISSYLSPALMGTHYADIQKSILHQAQKYVDSYQVFSETQAGGLYKVVGQVTVSMELLRNDLEEGGFPVGDSVRTTQAAGTETVRPETSVAESPPPPAAVQPRAGDAARQTSRGLSVTKREILWAAPEKWEQEWVLPAGRRDGSSLFSQGIRKELDGYDYTLHFPEPGSVKMDYTGNIPPSHVIALAQGMGIQEAVVGTVVLKQERNRPARLEANLRVLKVGSGKTEGEVVMEIGMEDFSNQEGALALASKVAPRLNSLLGGRAKAEKEPAPAVRSGEERSAAPSGTPSGALALAFPSAQYHHWKEMERILREQFKGMKVVSLEMGLTEGHIILEGVEGGFISQLNGTSLPSGATIRVESFSTEPHAVKLSFSPPANVQGGQAR